MKITGFCRLLLVLCVLTSASALAQNKKLDKALKKIDASYKSGAYSKAASGLKKFRSGAEKMGPQSNYMVLYYIREARINLAQGILGGFDASVNNALTASATAFGEDSKMYATTLLDAADLYNQYGNYRIARSYVDKSQALLSKVGQPTEDEKAHMAIIEAEAMIGQGFCNAAIDELAGVEKYYSGRAQDKETVVEDGQIKTHRLEDEEIYTRYNEYVKFKTLLANAYAKKGIVSIPGADTDNPSADMLFKEIQVYLKGKRRFLGDASIADIEYRYLWAVAFLENGSRPPSEADPEEALTDLRTRFANATSEMANELFQMALAQLMREDAKQRYGNTKAEYEKIIGKYPSGTVHKINLKAIEFNTKLSREKTKTLERDALEVLNAKSLPKNYKTSIKVLDFLYDVAIIEKRYKNAEGYLNQIAEVKKELCGENSPAYHLARVKLANFYIDFTNKIEEAGKIYENDYFAVVAKEVGVQHPDLIDILNHIAQWYELTDRYSLAAKTLNDAKDRANYKYTNTDILLGIELNNIANLQLKLGEYEQAEANLTAALQIIKSKDSRQYVEQQPALVATLQTQAKLYGIKGLFDEAEDNLEDAQDVIDKSGKTIGDKLSSAKELSALFIQLGKYSATADLLDELIPEYERLFGAGSIRLIEPLVNRGYILLANGDYTEAEKIALSVNQMAIKTYGESSTKTAPTQKLLSDIFYTLGDYEKAEANVLKAIASQEKLFGRNHIEVAQSLSQLALIKFHKGDNRQGVEKLLLESRDIIVTKLGKDNPRYAEILKNIAVLYISEKRYDIAFNSLTQAEAIWRAKTGRKNNVNAASIYTLTGDVYYQLKNYKKAEEFYVQSKDLYEKFFSKSHPEYVKVLSKLSRVYYMQKDYKRSKRLIEESLSASEGYIKQNFPALSERQKAKYWNTIKGDFEFYNTLAFSNMEDFKDLTGKVYNYQLLTKALLLSSSIKIRERIMNSTDEELKGQYNTWVQKKEQLTLALSMSPEQLTENKIDPGALQQEVEQLEKNLSNSSELFAQSFDTKRTTFDDIKKVLKPNEVAMEMVRYRYFNHTFTDSVIYAALYLRSDLPRPKAVILKDGKNMENRYFKFYRNAITGKIEDPYSYPVFWEPLQKEIGQAATLYLSPDGIYNQLNLEAIQAPDGRYVVDNSNIVLVSNTKDIYLRKIQTRAQSKENTASMFGNPSFYLAAASDHAITALPGTEKEVEQLKFMLNQKGWSTTEYLEKTATEEKIKELNSPKIFHIATHGLYRPTEQVSLEQEIEGNEAVLTQNPLLRTGLLLKGAGDLLDKTDHNYNMESGILTAYEAMSLNLDKTDLVVLSACETGLGDLEAGEGVYGLQRAFLVAGAKVLIMSMFKVDDDATQKLMLKFYQKWLNSGNLRQSFTDAKKELRIEYPEPIYWGAFMMIGLE